MSKIDEARAAFLAYADRARAGDETCNAHDYRTLRDAYEGLRDAAHKSRLMAEIRRSK